MPGRRRRIGGVQKLVGRASRTFERLAVRTGAVLVREREDDVAWNQLLDWNVATGRENDRTRNEARSPSGGLIRHGSCVVGDPARATTRRSRGVVCLPPGRPLRRTGHLATQVHDHTLRDRNPIPCRVPPRFAQQHSQCNLRGLIRS